MRFGTKSSKLQLRSVLTIAILTAVCGGLLVTTRIGAAHPQDGRPRRTSQAMQARPATTPTQTGQSPNRNASAVPKPTATPVPSPVTNDGRPKLGDAPPPPRLKPKPTPTPPTEIDEDTTIKVNTQLVNLHVRVIDRNNKPIDDVAQRDFHVFEDGVPQPI